MPLTIEAKTSATGTAILTLDGTLDGDTSATLLSSVRRALDQAPRIELDLDRVIATTTQGIATLAQCLSEAQNRNRKLSAAAIPPDLRRRLAALPALDNRAPMERSGLLVSLGTYLYEIANEANTFIHLFIDTLYWAFIAPWRGHRPPPGTTSYQALHIGANALPIVGLISSLMGLVMAFQAAYQLRQFGANIFIANLVGLAMVREMAPLITAIVIAGRSGSAIAAELATMRVGEELDALRMMGINPLRFLVVPRLYAISITQPLLTLFAMVLGIGGGFIIGVLYLDLSSAAYWQQTLRALTFSDLTQGLSKSLLFSWVIVLTACHYGFRVRGGPAGVGRATTTAVVTSIFSIIVVDSLYTTLVTLLE